MSKPNQLQHFSEGYDAGNYASSYVNSDLDVAWDNEEEFIEFSAFRAGFIIGFFSSYENDEIPEEHLEEFITARETWSRGMKKLGI